MPFQQADITRRRILISYEKELSSDRIIYKEKGKKMNKLLGKASYFSEECRKIMLVEKGKGPWAEEAKALSCSRVCQGSGAFLEDFSGMTHSEQGPACFIKST